MAFSKVVALSFCFIAVSFGLPCEDLTGSWRNNLGSNMTVRVLPLNRFTGRYSTSVESSSGASRFSTDISGVVFQSPNGTLLAWNVLWNRGASLTAWVGQCSVCDGQEILHTTWVLRSLMTPLKKWMTTRINQDTFYRVEGAAAATENTAEEEPIVCNPNSDLVGKYSSITGDSFELTCVDDVQHFAGVSKSGVSEQPISGLYSGNQTYLAMGFAATSSSTVKGWTGHIYNPQHSNKVLETSWLEHSFHDSCNDPRKFVRFGMDNYTLNADEDNVAHEEHVELHDH